MQVPHPARARVSRRKALIALASAGALSAGVAATGATAPVSAAPGDTTVQILSFNDYHGHVQSGTPGSIDGSFRGPAAGGGEYLSAKLTELRDASTADASFTVAAGDLIGGSPFFSGLFHDEPSVESLNAMGLDFSGVGNHEFDEGVDELLRMQNGGNHPVDGGYFDDYDTSTPELDEFGGADFQWLAANVTEDAPDGINDFEDSIPDYSIVEAADGKKVAFIGMTLEGTDELVAAAGIVGYTFEDEIAAGNAAVEAIQLEDPDVEAIVVMLHEGGIPTPFAINGCTGISGPIVDIAAGLSSEIDAIVTGHTHQPYTCSISDPDSNPRPVVSAFSFGRVVTEINLELDADGEVDRDTFTMENHEVLQNLPTDDPEVFTDAATDSAVTDIIAKWTPLAEERGNDPVGEITETVTRGGVPTGADRGVESAAGNLVADAQLFATADDLGAQIAFMNAGGLRSDLVFEQSDAEEGDGVVTYGEAFTFQPFNNTMFVLPMTGEQIIAVLVEQCQPGDNSRPVQHLGVSDGFTYDMDITLQDGVCTDIAVTNVQLDGVALDEAATYNVAVNNFLADGGDNFETFAEVAVTDRLPGPQDIDALISYFEDAGAPVAPPTTDRVNETITTLPASIASIDPARLLDTRIGENNLTVDGLFQGDDRVAAGGEIELQVSERGGVPSGAAAVVLNIGVINPTTSGFVTAYPCGTDRPTASNINFDAAATVSNAVFSGVGADGTVCVYSSSEAHLIADALSFVAAGGTPVAVEPARLLETRTGEANVTTDTLFQGDGRIAAGNSIELTVAGRGGVPSDAEAVVVNIGAVRPSENGFLTVYACGTDRPTASSVNYVADGVVSNSTTVPVGIGGTVCVYSSAETHLIADVNAYVPVGGSPAGLAPARLLDTRVGDGNVTIDNMFEGVGPVGIDGIELTVAGRGGVPADASTVVLNVGAIRPVGPGFVTVYACGADLPTASNINYSGGDIVSNSVVAKIGDDGKVCIFSSVDTELIVDVTAAVTPPVPFLPADA